MMKKKWSGQAHDFGMFPIHALHSFSVTSRSYWSKHELSRWVQLYWFGFCIKSSSCRHSLQKLISLQNYLAIKFKKSVIIACQCPKSIGKSISLMSLDPWGVDQRIDGVHCRHWNSSREQLLLKILALLWKNVLHASMADAIFFIFLMLHHCTLVNR